ncbi:MAG: flavin reductase family protein [Candidatus Bathyarchaeia archaeon]
MPWKNVEPSKIHRLFYPQVPVVITTEFEGDIGGMPAIWCMPLSFNPPLVGVAISPEHATFKLLIGAQVFGVNWLNFSFSKQMGELGETSAMGVRDKLSAVRLEIVKGSLTGQPLIRNAEGVLECRLHERHRIGTHELMVGEVVAASATESFSEYWDFSKYNPILYAGTVNIGGKCWVFRSGTGERVVVPLKHQV